MSTESKKTEEKKATQEKVGFWTKTKKFFRKPAVVNVLIGTTALAVGATAGIAYERNAKK